MSTNNLPPLPAIGPHDHPEPHTMKWTALEIKWVQDYASEYGQLCRQQTLEDLALEAEANGSIVLALQIRSRK